MSLPARADSIAGSIEPGSTSGIREAHGNSEALRDQRLGAHRVGVVRPCRDPDIDLVPEIVTQAYAAATLIDARSRPQRQAG